MTPYECFVMYSALKLHFNQEKFDFHQYNGKVRISKDAFEKRKDKYDFVKLVRKYSDTEMQSFLVSNFLFNKKIWSKDLLMPEAEDRFLEFQKRHQSMSYNFKNEIEKLTSKFEDLNDAFKCRSDEYPSLLRMTLQKDISLETFIILDSILNFVPIWNKKIDDTFLWPNFMLLCKKYKPFLQFDISKFRNILKQELALA